MSAYVEIPGVGVVLELDEEADEVAVAVGTAVREGRVMIVQNGPHGFVVVPLGTVGPLLVSTIWKGNGTTTHIALTDLVDPPPQPFVPRRIR